MRLCKDCKWIAFSDLREDKYRNAKCISPDQPWLIDFVTGMNESKFKYCDILRNKEDLCGPEGRWFEPK